MACAFAQSGGRITTPKGIYHGSPCSACTLFGLSATESIDSVPARTILGRRRKSGQVRGVLETIVTCSPLFGIRNVSRKMIVPGVCNEYCEPAGILSVSTNSVDVFGLTQDVAFQLQTDRFGLHAV